MDYSLLFCIEEVTEKTKMPTWSDHRRRMMFLSANKQYIYHLSLIDYLQEYDYFKKTENLIKNTQHSKRK